MRLIVIGKKLEKFLAEIVKVSQELGCNTMFFKENFKMSIDIEDVIIIDSDLVDCLDEDIKNTVISIVSSPNYVPSRCNEEALGVLGITKIADIILRKTKIGNFPIAVDPTSKNILKIAEKISYTDATVLITGETGSGKEILAKYIHDCSARSKNPFITVNCAAIPDTLLESEIFGHEKGAFTNALQRRIGKFEAAHLGTILLDEINEMSMNLQAKLLRVIQEKEITRLGSNDVIKTDVRIIATSNKDLQKSISEGLFREDLFYRLSVIPIEIPNLNSRPLDIEPLAAFFCKKYSKSQKTLSNRLLERLKDIQWNGNIRELENFIHRAVILSSGSIIECDDVNLENYRSRGHPCSDLSKTLKSMERELITSTVEKFRGNKELASKELGMPVRTLRHKISRYKMVGAAGFEPATR